MRDEAVSGRAIAPETLFGEVAKATCHAMLGGGAVGPKSGLGRVW